MAGMITQYWKGAAFYGVILAIALAIGYVFARDDYNAPGGLLALLMVLALSFVVIRKMGKAETVPWFAPLLIAALLLKIMAALARMQTNLDIYGGLYDAGRYLAVGRLLAENIREMKLEAVLPYLQFEGAWGTRYTEFYSGVVQTFVGPTAAGMYMVWAFFGFIGSYFYYRAFRVAFPQGNRVLYALVAFFLPSVLFWANGLGKDALMAAFIGLSAYGIARLFAGEYAKSWLPLALGLFGAFTVRPHMAGLIGIALLVAFALGGRRFISRSPVAFLFLILGAFGLIWYLVPIAAEYAGLKDVSFESVQEYVDHRQTEVSWGGGSDFKPPSLSNPLEFPLIYATVAIRPFPWEAHNIPALLQAGNGMLILGLFLWNFRMVMQALKSMFRNPFVIFILAYFVLFGPAFITIANFGTLAREQAMLHPLLLMLVAFRPEPVVKRAPSPSADSRALGASPPLASVANPGVVAR